MLLETLRADWAARATNARVSPLPEFAGGALTLGAGTKLAEARDGRRDEATEGERAVALVSVALGRPLDVSAATHVRRALAKAREGDAPLALTHLALAGAGRLTEPREDARRLFIADGLMKAGVSPRRSSKRSARHRSKPISTAPTTPTSRACRRATDGRADSGRAGIGRTKRARRSAAKPEHPASPVAPPAAKPVQIADASENWAQYLNPIASTEAAQTGGAAPYAQHQLGVAAAIAHYEALGYSIYSGRATAVKVPGFSSPRFYDFVVQSPDGVLIGVEVKTTLGETIF